MLMAKRSNPDDRQGEMFGSPAAPAVGPNPGTIARALLTRLVAGERIAQTDFDLSWRLSAYVRDLKNLGWPVLSEPIAYPRANRPISRYYLTASSIAAVRAAQGGSA